MENNRIAVIAVVALLLSVIGLGGVAYSYTESGAQAIGISGKVSTWRILDGAVTNAKMADNSIDSDDYVNGSLDNAHISDDAINSSQIIDDTIDSADYAAGSIDNEHLAIPKVNQSVSQALAYGDFTDGLGLSGHIDFTTDQVPAGAIPLGFKAVVATGFTGDTTAVIDVGISGDTNRFTADSTQSVLATATVGSNALAADACDGMNAAQTIRVTVTGTADFSSISAGSMVVTVYWVETE